MLVAAAARSRQATGSSGAIVWMQHIAWNLLGLGGCEQSAAGSGLGSRASQQQLARAAAGCLSCAQHRRHQQLPKPTAAFGSQAGGGYQQS